MPWIEATLRGQRVLARANDDGTLAAEEGRVEIRYNPKDGRAYRAGTRNLEPVAGAKVLADDACVPAADPSAGGATGSNATRGAGGGNGGRGKAPAVDVLGHSHVKTGAWIAYTDGACSGNPGPAGCGIVLVSPEGKMHEGFEYLGVATNNVAELTAILRAVEWLPRSAPTVVVHTDSQYAIGVLQKGWKAKANQELVAQAKKVVVGRGARLVYVPGHQGVVLNERADVLARESILQRGSQTVVIDQDR